jgi:acetylornithine deacetylase/succinyl-diaminopimelate desuccinylase family protein
VIAGESAVLLQREVERLRPDIVECLRGLVKIPSITGDEAAIAAHIKSLLQEMKFDVEVLEAVPGRPNLIATWDSGRPGRTLLLNDHLDMVPPGPLENWTHAPYAADIAEGRVYGRGTIDTKSGVTTMLMATRALVNTGLPINGKLVLAFSCDEEVAGDLGIKYLQKLGRLKADLALVTEPTTMKLELGTKGRLDLIFETHGVATHGARPWLGHNAIEDMMLVIASLQEYAESLASRTHPKLGRASLNVGKIEGGTVGNMVPSHCRIEVDRRVLPNEDVDSVMAEIQAILDGLCSNHPKLQVTMKKRIFWSGYVVEEEAPVVQIFRRAFASVVGAPTELGYKDAGTDAPYIFLSGTPVVMFSPGNGHRAMNADENVDIADLVLATRVVAQFIHDVLVLPEESS